MKLRVMCVLSVIVAMLFSVVASLPTAYARTPDVSIWLDGRRLASDTAPYIKPKVNLTMVPIRIISAGIGANVDWSQRDKTATIRQGGKTIALTVGRKYATVDGARVALETSVELRNSRVMLPLRFVAEQLGLDINWHQQSYTISLASKTPPAQPAELRGAWISTVYNIDWPTPASAGNPAVQQQEYAALLDDLQAAGINAVFVQVRPAGDALYASSLVPWSKYVSGVQGRDPGYDPLAYMIEETHRRNMEFHAWFNPFRANADAGKAAELAPDHVVNVHPEWIVRSGNIQYINPGIPEARQHIIDTIMEVVNGYAVDGIHLDDYFYPSNGNFDDQATYAAYNNGSFANIGDWRRDNINRFVRELGAAIRAAKPFAEFGISPFGVWRNKADDPTGSDTRAGVSTYDDMYADTRTWIRQGWVDYIMPQVYWSLSLSVARYDILVDWWANEVKGTNVKLYIGHAAYKLGTNESGWHTSEEIVNQIKYNRLKPEVKGDVFFSARTLRANPLGLVQALQALYRQPS